MKKRIDTLENQVTQIKSGNKSGNTDQGACAGEPNATIEETVKEMK